MASEERINRYNPMVFMAKETSLEKTWRDDKVREMGDSVNDGGWCVVASTAAWILTNEMYVSLEFCCSVIWLLLYVRGFQEPSRRAVVYRGAQFFPLKILDKKMDFI